VISEPCGIECALQPIRRACSLGVVPSLVHGPGRTRLARSPLKGGGDTIGEDFREGALPRVVLFELGPNDPCSLGHRG
jgi:hypothetical protein